MDIFLNSSWNVIVLIQINLLFKIELWSMGVTYRNISGKMIVNAFKNRCHLRIDMINGKAMAAKPTQCAADKGDLVVV